MDVGLFVGRQLVLVTGQIGSGKSHFCVSAINAIRQQMPELTVYSDIDGLNIDGVLQSPDDWHDCEKNSIVFYDEAQKRDWFSNSNKRINSDNRVTDLTTIRHEGMTIVFITQDPSFLHPALTKLIKTHYHVSNPFENDKPKVFEFNKAVRQIDDKGRYQSQAINQFTHYLDKDIYPLYKSVNDGAEHKKTRKKPKKIYYMIAFIGLLVMVGIPIGYLGIKTVYNFIYNGEEQVNTATKSVQVEPVSQPTTTGNYAVVTAENGATVKIRQDLYEVFLPSKDYHDIVNDENLRPAMVVTTPEGCKAYNRYGDFLKVSDDYCQLMADNHSLIPRTRQQYNLSSNNQPIPESQEQSRN